MIKLNIEVKISKIDLISFGNDFLECGSFTWWACLGNDDEHFKEFRKQHDKLYLGEVLIKYLLEGNSITIYDTESDDKWELTIDKLLSGIKQEMEYTDNIEFNNNWDFYNYDRVLQFALFNEIVFG